MPIPEPIVAAEERVSPHTKLSVGVPAGLAADDMEITEMGEEPTPLPLVRARYATPGPGAYSVDGRNVHRRPTVEQYDSHRGISLSSTSSSSSIVLPEPQPDIVIGGAVLADEQDLMETAPVTRRSELVEGILEQQRRKRNTSCAFWVMIAAILVGGLTLILTLALRSDGSTSTTSSNTTKTTTKNSTNQDLILYPPFTENQTANITLPPPVAAQIQELNSGRYWANRWMLQDPLLLTYPPNRQWQRFHMVSLYYMMDGPNWHRKDHWLSYNVSECEWYSSSHLLSEQDDLLDDAVSKTICDESLQLKTLNVSGNNLKGSFPRLTHFIPTIQYYDISQNQLSGTLPVLSHQPDMTTYFVHKNLFSGRFEGRFSSFKVRHIKTHDNGLEGQTPQLWPLMKFLTTLDNSANLYQDTMATEVGTCTQLTYFKNADNLLHGNIPSELGLLTNLNYFNASGNTKLNGTIPLEFGNWSLLEVMDLTRTSFTGPIPTLLCERYWNQSLKIYANCSQIQCCDAQ